MKNRNYVRLALATALFLGSTAHAIRAADDIFTLVPEASVGFVMTGRLADVDAKVSTLAKTLAAPLPGPLNLLKTVAGLEKGIDLDRGLMAAVLPLEKSQDGMDVLVWVPVSNIKAFAAQFGAEPSDEIQQVEIASMPLRMLHRGDYAVLARPNAESLLKQLADDQLPAATLSKPLCAWIATRDVALVLRPSGVALATKAGLSGLEMMKQGFAQAAGQIDESQVRQVQAGLELYTTLLKQFPGELSRVGVGLRVDKDGNFFVGSHAGLTPDGKLAALTRNYQPADQHLLKGLPAGAYVAAGGGAWHDALSNVMTSFTLEMFKNSPDLFKLDELSDDERRDMEKILKNTMRGVHSVSFLVAPGKSGDPLYSNFVGLIRVDDASQYLADYRKGAALYARLGFGGNTVKQQIKTFRPSFASADALKVELDMRAILEAQAAPQAEQMLRYFFGPGDTMTTYLVPLDQNTVAVGFISIDRVAQLAAHYQGGKTGLEQNAALLETESLLPKDAQWKFYIAPQGVLQFVTQMTEAILPEGARPNLPKFPATPPLAAAATVSPLQIEKEFLIPNAFLKAIPGYIQQVKQAQLKLAEPEAAQ